MDPVCLLNMQCQRSVQAGASTSTASDTSKAILHTLRRKTVHKEGYHVPILGAEARSTALYVALYSRKLTKPLTLNNIKEKHAGSLHGFSQLSLSSILLYTFRNVCSRHTSCQCILHQVQAVDFASNALLQQGNKTNYAAAARAYAHSKAQGSLFLRFWQPSEPPRLHWSTDLLQHLSPAQCR